MVSLRSLIADIYRKNRDDLTALVTDRYPEFVYHTVRDLRIGEIPIFVFHSVHPRRFESQLSHLAENGYRTVTADELQALLEGRQKAEGRLVALAFDDGRGSLWSSAYPLLKKYGFSAISFIISAQVEEDTHHYPNLEDVWSGRSSLEEVEKRESFAPLCNWNEIREMHDSGVIDFQSHTSNHHSVYVSDRLVDFVTPSSQPSFLKGTLYPAIRKGGFDVFPRKPDWGRPIYRWAPSMVAVSRYLEDEAASQACIELVDREGGEVFFKRRSWRSILKNRLSRISRGARTFQPPEVRYAEIRRDLGEAKETIEAKLNKRVNHLCYPWYAGSEMSVRASQEVGYCANYWGILGRRTVNRVGNTPPFHIVRMNEDYIFSLPGKGRKPLYQVLAWKFHGTTAG